MNETTSQEDVWCIATFYKFVHLPHCDQLRDRLLKTCNTLGVKGTIVLAPEGINGTICGSPRAITRIVRQIRAEPPLEDIEFRLSDYSAPPFARMKIKLREEIVTLGVDDIDPETMAGTYVSPEAWNTLITRHDVVVIDTRNDYETAIGSFVGARDPGIASFSELPDWIQQQDDLAARPPIAMFCTGGIRCEKSTAYLRRLGFEEVYHLRGGILNYLDTIPEAESLWRGECFVFDERVSIIHGLRPGNHRLCSGCGRPLPIHGGDNGLPVCASCGNSASDGEAVSST